MVHIPDWQLIRRCLGFQGSVDRKGNEPRDVCRQLHRRIGTACIRHITRIGEAAGRGSKPCTLQLDPTNKESVSDLSTHVIISCLIPRAPVPFVSAKTITSFATWHSRSSDGQSLQQATCIYISDSLPPGAGGVGRRKLESYVSRDWSCDQICP